MQKIFGLGFSKTGTKSLCECFRILGYKCAPYGIIGMLEDLTIKGDFSRVFAVARMWETFEDLPWPLVYREIDHEFPGSKFILTMRKDPETWLRSYIRQAERWPGQFAVRKMAYGYDNPHGYEKEHIKLYNDHIEHVKRYFKNRPDDFLVLNWEEGDGWEKLCAFLGKEVPNVALPHSNIGYIGDL